MNSDPDLQDRHKTRVSFPNKKLQITWSRAAAFKINLVEIVDDSILFSYVKNNLAQKQKMLKKKQKIF